ncbi:hypothetical protein FDECE_13499 [Fusarium decemcellulare]|nr:hypothetical protein FDECE_13499 [Fusarium decemcellulare]
MNPYGRQQEPMVADPGSDENEDGMPGSPPPQPATVNRDPSQSPTPEVQSSHINLKSDDSDVCNPSPSPNPEDRPTSGEAVLVDYMDGGRNPEVCRDAAKKGLPALRTDSADGLGQGEPVDDSRLPVITLQIHSLTKSARRSVFEAPVSELLQPSHENGDVDDRHHPQQQGLKRSSSSSSLSDTDKGHKRLCPSDRAPLATDT